MNAHQFDDSWHIAYEKIPENPNQWKLAESDYRAFKKTEWVVTEKIHGANFCIGTDGNSVRFAKRKEELQPDEDFFGFKSLSPRLIAQAKAIFSLLRAEKPNILRISIYGELFGGEYPHPDVLPNLNVQAVQTGIYYSPHIEYCAFDIAIVESRQPNKVAYLDYDCAIELFQQVGMLGAVPLFVGKYESALAYNIEFDSTIPALLGLPKLSSQNLAEGVVIKPLKAIYLETAKGRIRPILKRKIPEFAEDSRFHQAQKWTAFSLADSPQQVVGAGLEETFLGNHTRLFTKPAQLELSQQLLSLVTETRLSNVISKVGRVPRSNTKMKQRLIQLLVTDVLESFNEHYESQFEILPLPSQQELNELVTQASKSLVDSYFNK